MHKQKWGSYSTGSLFMGDLIPASLDAAEDAGVEPAKLKSFHSLWDRLAEFDDEDTIQEIGSEEELNIGKEKEWLYAEIVQTIEEALPSYFYYGSTEGDGADIGIWPDWPGVEEDIRCKEIEKYDNLPESKTTDYVVTVTDHGNVTLWVWDEKEYVEVWGIV